MKKPTLEEYIQVCHYMKTIIVERQHEGLCVARKHAVGYVFPNMYTAEKIHVCAVFSNKYLNQHKPKDTTLFEPYWWDKQDVNPRILVIDLILEQLRREQLNT